MFLAAFLDMSSIWKHPESKYWFACFKRADGTRTKLSTKTTDRKLALKLAEQFEQSATKKQTSLNARRIIQDLHASITGDDIGFPSVRKHFDEWVVEKKGEVAGATLIFYQGVAKKFLTWLGKRADEDLVAIESRDIKSFRSDEFKTLSAKTVNHEIKTLRMIFNAARASKLITDDPAEFVKTIKDTTEAKRRPFSITEIQSVLAVADDEWKSMVLFGLYLGQRLIDIATLRSTNIDLVENVVKLKARKTGKPLSIGIAPALRKHIESLDIQKGANIPLHRLACAIVEKQGKSGHLSNQFANILAKAGLRKKKTHRKTGEGRGANRDATGLSFHSLRHTSVTLMKEAGIPHAVVQEMIGHDSEQMSRHYTHVGTEALQKAANALPDVTIPREVDEGQ